MMRRLALALLLWASFSGPVLAANCAPFTFTLTNGQTADATQVMSDFNNLLNCSNNNLAHNGSNADITALTALTTPITVGEGGTGLGSLTLNALVVGNGASAVTFLSPGPAGDVVTSNPAGGGPWQSVALRGYLSGLILSNDGTNPNTTIDVAAGTAADSTNAHMITIAAFTKNTSGTFVAGTGNAGLDTGAIATNTWYFVFLIIRTDTNVTDILFSLSATSPALPTNYTLFRRIGEFKTAAASTNILTFIQQDDEFLWRTQVTDINADTTLSNAVKQYTLADVPPTTKITARLVINFTNTSAGTGAIFYSPNVTTTPSVANLLNPVAGVSAAGEFFIRTNASQQINAISGAAANNTVTIAVGGWTDTRGKQN